MGSPVTLLTTCPVIGLTWPMQMAAVIVNTNDVSSRIIRLSVVMQASPDTLNRVALMT
jgi:hypothetical protein